MDRVCLSLPLVCACCLVLAAAQLPPPPGLSAPRDQRTIDIQTGDAAGRLSEDRDSKFMSAIKRKYAIKHPFIITKEDIDGQDSIVEDNIIVESNVLHLNRPTKRISNELARSRRVRRGWNLQHVIVPDDPIYHRVPMAESRQWVSRPMGRSKLHWADGPSKHRVQYGHRGWGAGVQNLHSWPTKIYG